jgi:TATA-binding protein-associated factor Taf7
VYSPKRERKYKICNSILQSLYRNQVKELKDEIEGKNKNLQDAQADLKSVDQEK